MVKVVLEGADGEGAEYEAVREARETIFAPVRIVSTPATISSQAVARVFSLSLWIALPKQ